MQCSVNTPTDLGRYAGYNLLMNNDVIKNIHLHDELNTAVRLIEIGLGEFQNLDMGNDFYHLTFQLLSSGFERLMKCHICLGFFEKHGEYPNFKYLKNCGKPNGHDLIQLKKIILNEYFSTHSIPVLIEDKDYLSNNSDLDKLIYLLSEFGKYARYYNFDVVTAASKPSVDVKTLWEDYESSILVSNQDLLEKASNFEFQEEVLNSIQRKIIITLEKFTRAIARQFTIGKLGTKALQYGPTLNSFLHINDNVLGCKDYRSKTTRFKNKKTKVHKRGLIDNFNRKFNSDYKHKIITKESFDGDWPFYKNRITVECREKHWCIVTIGNKDYALNGSAKGRYNLKDVHEAGMAILGKSIGPFIDIALNL